MLGTKQPMAAVRALGTAWRPYTAVQALAPLEGFLWAVTTHLFGLPINGFDRYSNGVGEMRMDLPADSDRRTLRRPPAVTIPRWTNTGGVARGAVHRRTQRRTHLRRLHHPDAHHRRLGSRHSALGQRRRLHPSNNRRSHLPMTAWVTESLRSLAFASHGWDRAGEAAQKACRPGPMSPRSLRAVHG